MLCYRILRYQYREIWDMLIRWRMGGLNTTVSVCTEIAFDMGTLAS